MMYSPPNVIGMERNWRVNASIKTPEDGGGRAVSAVRSRGPRKSIFLPLPTTIPARTAAGPKTTTVLAALMGRCGARWASGSKVQPAFYLGMNVNKAGGR
jgi:hypothetical protein